MKTYDVPHKGLRNALSQLQLLAGKTDYSNQQEVAHLCQLGDDVFKILTVHATDENEVTLAELELRCAHFTDEELASHRGKIMSKLPPQTLLIWFKFIIPAQNHKERAGLLKGFKKMAPSVFYVEALEVIKQVLSEKEFSQLNEALA